jgi:hypothetical protein
MDHISGTIQKCTFGTTHRHQGQSIRPQIPLSKQNQQNDQP